MNRRSFVAALGTVALLGWTQRAYSADSIDVAAARLDVQPAEDGARRHIVLSAEFVIGLTDTLRHAVERGLPLYFVVEFQAYRRRWYWTNKEMANAQVEWRLSYHALTRQYRVATDLSTEGFGTLEEALASMSRIDRRAVANADDFEPDVHYQAYVQMRLDTGRLPKPFQMTAMTNSDWSPQSEWKRFDFSVPPIPKSDR